MKISTKGRYAVRVMLDLAAHSTGELIALKEIAERQQLSAKYLEQIIRHLATAGLLKSVRGPQGGYKLAKKPSEYSLGDILRITEGSLAPVACLEDETNQCERYKSCSTITVWEGLNKVIQEYINGVSLQDILDQSKNNGNYDYII